VAARIRGQWKVPKRGAKWHGTMTRELTCADDEIGQLGHLHDMRHLGLQKESRATSRRSMARICAATGAELRNHFSSNHSGDMPRSKHWSKQF